MADDDAEKIFSSSSSRPFTVRSGFPFVFLPSAFTEGFTFVNHPGDDASPADEQVKSDSAEKKTTDDDDDEDEDDERDHNDDNADETESTSDLRISQPKYSQLLKDLDFSKARMVDVTDILSKNRDSPANYLSPDENENLNKTSGDEKYQSLSSARASDSSDESDEQPTATGGETGRTEQQDENFRHAADEIQNDLNNLAAIIQAAAQMSNVDDDEEQSVERKPNPIMKKSTFDEDDDTSKQATQNYDLHDFEQEDVPASTKSQRITLIVSQQSSSEKNEQSESEGDKDEEIRTEAPITWEKLVYGEAPANDEITWENLVNGEETKNEPRPPPPVEKPAESTKTNENFEKRFRRISDSSSSNTESVVDRELFVVPQGPLLIGTASSEQTASRNVPQAQRQDSQGTLIDENLDDLTSQLKQVLFDQERQTFNTSTKEERTTDGIGSMSIPLSTPDKLSTDILDNDDENLGEPLRSRHISATQPFHEQTHRSGGGPATAGTSTFEIPQRLPSTKKKSHHRHHHHRHSASRLIDRDHESNLRHSDDNWLNLLEKLEREHRSRLEKQQQQYENYMQDLEEKMQRRFDEYLTLTSGFQESRLHNYDDVSPLHRTHTTVPIDTNIGRYKTHSSQPAERPVVKDLISHYYPADSTLNILNSGKRRTGATSSNSSTVLPRSPSKDELINVRAELSARHAKHLAELKSYEHEINEIKDQINRTKMGHASSVTRQSMDTIERINNENIRLQDEMNEIRHSLKLTQDENILLKRQLDDLRTQINSKDIELKNYHRTIADLEQQLTEAENTKERRDEKFRHADRQALLYREENEKLKIDLNLTRDRLIRLEERYRELEAENESLRRQVFKVDHENLRTTSRPTEDVKLSSRDYARFPLSTSSILNGSRETNLSNTEPFYRHHHHSPRPLTRITDYLNEKPIYPPPYIPPSKPIYSPRKTSPSPRRRYGSSNLRSSTERPSKPSDQLEQKFDQLLKRKRDLEARMSRIPTRNLTSTDRQLYDVLEREISRVEQQISSVKLELRKLNVFPVH